MLNRLKIIRYNLIQKVKFFNNKKKDKKNSHAH